jgi:hypothetical protein
MTKPEIIKSILKAQDATFRNSVTSEFKFYDNVIESSNVKTVIGEKETAFSNRLQTYLVENSKGLIDMKHFLDKHEKSIIKLIKKRC